MLIFGLIVIVLILALGGSKFHDLNFKFDHYYTQICRFFYCGVTDSYYDTLWTVASTQSGLASVLPWSRVLESL